MNRSFVFYEDWARLILDASPDISEKLVKAILQYFLYGTEPEDPTVKCMFSLIKSQMDRNAEKWKAISEKRSEAAKRSHLLHMSANAAVNVDEDVDVNGNVTNNNVCLKYTGDIDIRKNSFKEELLQYKEDYGDDCINRFFNYWTEPTPDGKHMRFELEETFGIENRLYRWNNEQK